MYVYGPVPSRRLGNSLGVDIIPRKTCSYSCIYCQIGRTKVRQIVTQSFYHKESIIDEIDMNVERSAPDFITFVGDGEPTLSCDLGWLINRCKSRWTIPVAVITNGSLLFKPEIRDSLANADIVMPSLDAGNEEVFHKINRPHAEIKLKTVVDGMMAFSREFSGRVRLEVMLVEGVNDDERHLTELKDIINAINPDTVDISVPIRPPAEKWVKPPSLEKILFARELLKGNDSMTTVEHGDFGLANFNSVLQAIEQLSSRHPLRLNQAQEIERLFSRPGEIKKLLNKGLLRKEEYQGEVFILPNERYLRD